jgi:hypothetical protein
MKLLNQLEEIENEELEETEGNEEIEETPIEEEIPEELGSETA